MANILNLEVDQGADYEIQLTIKNEDTTPVDVTGFIFSGLARLDFSADVALSFVFEIIDAVNGIVKAKISAPTSSAFSISDTTSLVYDIEMQAGISGITKRLVEGKIKLKPEVTK